MNNEEKEIPEKYKLSTYNYHLPESFIAQYPVKPRDSSRLLFVDSDKEFEETKFWEVIKFLRTGDLLVLNDTRVFTARIYGHKETGAKIEFLLLKSVSNSRWNVLARPGKRLDNATKVFFDSEFYAKIIAKNDDGSFLVEFSLFGEQFWDALEKHGRMPLPHYIKRSDIPADRNNYQTVYAKNRGAVAAPTAGLHFTEKLIEKIKAMGIEIAFITLNVSWGTFEPVKAEDIREHNMHREYYIIPETTADMLNDAIKNGRRIIAVGTTTTRALESSADRFPILPQKRWTDLYIYPDYEFKLVDCMITNFHLPKSSLLIMVSAFAGIDTIKNAYRYAIENRFRFYSYGDAMFLCRN
ncbi:tRNA preQ1(34) S-adenosylmethionine ribosyltransferase-isomerase QueA [bacterium]|nr:MAG: tRNA preQ1(34) S-adenosylmethionine ribosyltransferase-isomerase QueA [bacterium]